ncbi:MAG TPA: amino acid adenylation domain-containing protein, partial [Thermoanaerobaculia bacterium]|nr:amino acid adenylation domain-containing protein [Thermoanaerobaculia bacterium]
MIRETAAWETVDELSPEQREFFERLLAEDDVEIEEREPIPRRPWSEGTDAVPLSFAQQRLWILHQLEPRSAAYNMPSALRMEGGLDRRALAAALEAVVCRHESLRTVFHEVEGQPLQSVVYEARVPLPVADLSGLAPGRRQAEAAALFQAEVLRPFDLKTGPLLRALLFALGGDEHVLLFTVHHIASDGWSTGVLVRELGPLYEACRAGRPAALPALPIQYADFAVWQRQWLQGEVLEGQLAYWRERLAGVPPVLDLPADRPRPAARRERGRLEPFALPMDLLRDLKALAGDQDATLFMVLLAGFAVLLQRYTGQDDLAVGTPIAGRNRAETEGLIGLFVNTLVMRADLSGDPTFLDLVRRARETALGAYAHQDLPFERLIDELEPVRDLSRTPLFQVMLVLRNMPLGPLQLEGLSLEVLELEDGTAKLDLLLTVGEEADGLAGWIQYDSDLFDRPTVARMAAHLRQLLAAAVAAPAGAVSQLPLQTAAERHQLLAESNDTAVDFGADLRLHDWIARQAALTPDAVAVVFEGAALSYGALDARANRLGRRLRRLGVGAESVVGICAERSVELMIGLLAILEAGGAYLPLDPSYPAERLAFMVEDGLSSAGRPVLLLQGRFAPLFAGWSATAARRIDLDRLGEERDGGDDIAVESETVPEGAAYVIYTSGSTGRPKGVVNTHRGICNRLLWMQAAYGLEARDVVLQKTPVSFDVSVWELFWPLMFGARLVLARPDGHRDSAYLVDLIEEQEVTTLHFVPSMLQAFLEEPDLGRCVSLRQIMASGEALPSELARRCLAGLGAELHNLYGPTEAAVDVTFHACRAAGVGEAPGVPIGRPIANLGIWLLDRGLQPVPLGVPGELYIGGVGLARGYRNRPGLTAERFVPHPLPSPEGELPGERLYRTGDLARFLPGGAIDFLGRTDHQVKIRGFRIELGEIEAALASHPEVKEAAVLAQDGPAGKRLMAYVVARDAAADPGLAERLRGALQQSLPAHMVPAGFVLLPALPLSVNGKLDRRRLEALGTGAALARQEYVRPETPAERALAEVWAEVLGVDKVSAADNFFALGGDSILGIRVLAGARQRGLDLELRQLFQHQTLRELARQAPGGAGEEAPPLPAPFDLIAAADRRRLPEGLEDAWPLSRLQAGMLFHSEYSPETAVYHDILSYHVAAPFDAALFAQAVERLLAAHPVLRAAFDLTTYGEPLQLIYSTVAADLQVEDLRGLDREEQEAALTVWMEEEKEL